MQEFTVDTAENPIDAFANLVRLLPDCVMTLDREGRITSFNLGAERLYGVAAADVIGKHGSVLVTDHDDQARLFERVVSGEIIPPSEAIRPLADGRRIAVMRSMGPLLGPEGEIIGVCVISHDISAELAERTAREHVEEQLRRSFDTALIATSLVSLDGIHMAVNDAACRLLGRTREELTSTNWEEFTHLDHRGEITQARAAALSGGDEGHIRQKRYLLPDGRTIWAEVHDVLVRNPDGTPSHFVIQLQDITHRRQEESRLRKMAERDPLTGLLNRRGFETVLEAHLRDLGRYTPSGALLMVDLDNFKHHNDTYGHNAGDELLAGIGRCLSDHLRGSDTAGRIGGDEFLVLLPHAHRDGAETVARMLLKRIQNTAAAITGDTDRPVTASIGVTCFDAAGKVSIKESLEQADSAMYEAKRLGKGRLAFYERAYAS